MSKANGTATKKPSLTAAAKRTLAQGGEKAASRTPRTATLIVKTAQVSGSPLNPRKTFNDAETKELGESLNAFGMLQPMLVRPCYRTTSRAAIARDNFWHTVDGFPGLLASGLYEVADGERRLRAAKLIGLAEVPIRVQELTDRQMLEIMIVSFEQRSDVKPLEKAAAYQRLIDQEGATVEELATRIGRSEATIRNMLKLPKLPPIAVRALHEERLPIATAGLISRVGSEQARQDLAVWILCNTMPDPEGDLSPSPVFERIAAKSSEVMSFVDADKLIKTRFQLQLKAAPFSRKALDLVDGATSCDACPKRTGNAPDDFPGSRADVCTDPSCFRQKVAAHSGRLLLAAARDGYQPMGDRDLRNLFDPGGQVVSWSGWKDLDQDFETGRKGKAKTYRELIGKQVQRHTVAAVDGQGKLRLLAPSAQVNQALEAAGLIPSSAVRDDAPAVAETDREAHTPAGKETGAEPRLPPPHAISLRAAKLAGDVVYSMAVENAEGLDGLVDDPVNTSSPLCVLRLLCLCAAWEGSGGEGERELADGILTLMDDLTAKGTPRKGVAIQRVEQLRFDAYRNWTERATPAQLLGFLLKAFCLRLMTYPESPSCEPAQALLEFGELDWEQLKSQAVRELTGQASPAAAGDANPSPATSSDAPAKSTDKGWERHVRYPADVAVAANHDVGQKLEVKGAEAGYNLVELPDGRWAIRFELALVSHHRSTPWDAYQTAADCLRDFADQATKFFAKKPGLHAAKNEQQAHARMSKALPAWLDKLASPTDPGEPWRNIALADLGLPKLFETNHRKAGRLSAGQVADWLDHNGGSIGASAQRKCLETARAKCLAVQPRPGRLTVARDTLLTDLATEGGRDPVVGYEQTLAQLEPLGVRTVGELMDKRVALQHTEDFGVALYQAIRTAPGVSADMAKRVTGQLTELLRPFWTAPVKAGQHAAKVKSRRCRECNRAEEQLGAAMFVKENLCSDCTPTPAEAVK